MTVNSTFGFEAEFAENASDLVGALYRTAQSQRNVRYLIGSDILHRYHCDCDTCSVNREDAFGDQTFDLRAQNDSSCSGEVISKIYENVDDARPTMKKIEEHAIEVDAIPGWDAGFHVHVGIRDLRNEMLNDAFFEYMRWEAVLTWLAGGRWWMIRENNQPVSAQMIYEVATRSDSYPVPERWGTYLQKIRNSGGTSFMERKSRLYSIHRDQDRHSYLSTHTRHRTWEFRLWNSTRSAWRMELFVGLSRAMLDMDLITQLQAYDEQIDANTTDHVAAFVAALEASGNNDIAELTARQVDYLTTKAHQAPESFELLNLPN